jgi:hypothetical protein
MSFTVTCFAPALPLTGMVMRGMAATAMSRPMSG